MRFVARHVSFLDLDGVRIFALGDKPVQPGEAPPDVYVVVQFGNEGDQERTLGLTGLHIETSRGSPDGYGCVEHITYDGQTVRIIGRDSVVNVEAEIGTDMMTTDEIREAVDQCNQANNTRPEKAA